MTITINFSFLKEGGGGHWGQRGKKCPKCFFCGKRHDNQILKAQILLSRNFVVIAQAPTFPGNYSISEAQIFEDFRRKSQIFAGNRRLSQKAVCPI